MKRPAFATVESLTEVRADELVFSSWVREGGRDMFAVKVAREGGPTRWLAAGEEIAGWTVAEFQPGEEPVLSLKRGSETTHLLLQTAVIREGAAAASAPQSEADALWAQRFPVAYILSQRVIADEKRAAEAAAAKSAVSTPPATAAETQNPRDE